MDSAPTQLNWNQLYYDSVEHLLWNPDWIRGRQPDGTPKTIRMLMQRLERLEAPLHHSVHLFLTLAPPALIAKFLRIDPSDAAGLRIIGCRSYEQFQVFTDKKRSLLDLCQPDILIESDTAHIAVEIKSKSKSTLEQLLKYVAFLMLRSRNAPAPVARKLVYLAPCETFSDLWKRNAYGHASDLRDAAQNFVEPNLDRKLRRLGTSLDEVKSSLDGLEIDWISIRDVRRDVREEKQQLSLRESFPSSEVYLKLLAGFETELLRWQADE